MIEHLKHMAEVRPDDGLDRDAARWAIAEIERLRAALEAILTNTSDGGAAECARCALKE